MAFYARTRAGAGLAEWQLLKSNLGHRTGMLLSEVPVWQ